MTRHANPNDNFGGDNTSRRLCIEICASDLNPRWVHLAGSEALPVGTRLLGAGESPARHEPNRSKRRRRGQTGLLVAMSIAFVASTWVAVHFIREFNERGKVLNTVAAALRDRDALCSSLERQRDYIELWRGNIPRRWLEEYRAPVRPAAAVEPTAISMMAPPLPSPPTEPPEAESGVPVIPYCPR